MGKTCRSRKLKLSCSRDFCIVWTSLIYATNCPQKMQNNPTNDSFKGKLILVEEMTYLGKLLNLALTISAAHCSMFWLL